MEDVLAVVMQVILVEAGEELRQRLGHQHSLLAVTRAALKGQLGSTTSTHYIHCAHIVTGLHAHCAYPATAHLVDEVSYGGVKASDDLHDGVVAGRVELILQPLAVRLVQQQLEGLGQLLSYALQIHRTLTQTGGGGLTHQLLIEPL